MDDYLDLHYLIRPHPQLHHDVLSGPQDLVSSPGPFLLMYE